MIWGSKEDGTGVIELSANEQQKLHDATHDEVTTVSKVTGCFKGYFKLSVTLTPIDDPYKSTA